MNESQAEMMGKQGSSYFNYVLFVVLCEKAV